VPDLSAGSAPELCDPCRSEHQCCAFATGCRNNKKYAIRETPLFNIAHFLELRRGIRLSNAIRCGDSSVISLLMFPLDSGLQVVQSRERFVQNARSY